MRVPFYPTGHNPREPTTRGMTFVDTWCIFRRNQQKCTFKPPDPTLSHLDEYVPFSTLLSHQILTIPSSKTLTPSGTSLYPTSAQSILPTQLPTHHYNYNNAFIYPQYRITAIADGVMQKRESNFRSTLQNINTIPNYQSSDYWLPSNSHNKHSNKQQT